MRKLTLCGCHSHESGNTGFPVKTGTNNLINEFLLPPYRLWGQVKFIPKKAGTVMTKPIDY